MEEKYYIGDKRVVEVTATELTTPAGGAIVRVVYDANGGEELITNTRFEAIRTFKKSDASKARDRVVQAAGRKLYALLMEYGPYLPEINPMFNEAVRLSNAAIEQASNVLWKVQHDDERSLLDVNNILLKHYGEHTAATKPEAADDGASSERSTVDKTDTTEGEVRSSDSTS